MTIKRGTLVNRVRYLVRLESTIVLLSRLRTPHAVRKPSPWNGERSFPSVTATQNRCVSALMSSIPLKAKGDQGHAYMIYPLLSESVQWTTAPGPLVTRLCDTGLHQEGSLRGSTLSMGESIPKTRQGRQRDLCTDESVGLLLKWLMAIGGQGRAENHTLGTRTRKRNRWLHF